MSRADIAVAKVVVKKMIRAGVRKGPSDLLLLSDAFLESWYEDDAKRYLEENLKAKQARGS